MTIHATVTIVRQDNKLLLQKKSTGRFGEGKWNGPGGKLKPDETLEECAVREVMEETNLRIGSLKLHGTLKHYFGEVDKPTWIVFHFYTTEFEGELKDKGEGELRWFPLNEIPYQEMWQDDKHWLPLLLDGRDFAGDFYFNAEGTELLRHSLEIEE